MNCERLLKKGLRFGLPTPDANVPDERKMLADRSRAEPLHATVHEPISSKYCFQALLGRLI
jgi:hypothetical protein